MSKASTADWVAGARALHRREAVRMIDDPFAALLCGGRLRMVLRFRLLEWIVVERLLGDMKPVTMCILMRARYAEQALESAMARGVAQYVIVGAGMDSFAFRRPDLLGRLDVFEIDQPAMQQTKRDRLRKAGLQIPPQLHFIPADLERVSLVDALSGSNFHMARPAVLSLLGLTYYLKPETLAHTLGSIATHLAADSQVVFDYLLDVESMSSEQRDMRQRMKEFVARRGEPMLGAYSRTEMSALAAAADLAEAENIALIELQRRYQQELGAMPTAAPPFFALATYRSTARPDEARSQG